MPGKGAFWKWPRKSQSVFNSVQEVGVASGGDIERSVGSFLEDRSPRVVDGRKTYDKSGRQRRGTGIPSQTGIGIRVRASKRLLVGEGGNLLVGLAITDGEISSQSSAALKRT